MFSEDIDQGCNMVVSEDNDIGRECAGYPDKPRTIGYSGFIGTGWLRKEGVQNGGE